MKVNYDDITDFMRKYCVAFTKYGQDLQHAKRMEDYLVKDLEFIPYIGALAPIRGRDKFIEMETSHPSSHEILEPEEIIVDEKRLIAVVLIHMKLEDKATGKILLEKRYFPLYQLIIDEKNSLKIKKILFFEEVLAPGSLDMADLLSRDNVKNLFSAKK